MNSINLNTADATSGVKALQNVSTSIESIDKDITKLTSKGDLSTLSDQLNSLESGKIEVATAFTLATLMYMALKVQGINCGAASGAGVDQAHPIHTELKRIKLYVERVNKAATTTTTSAAASTSTAASTAASAATVTHTADVTAVSTNVSNCVLDTTDKRKADNAEVSSSRKSKSGTKSISKKARIY